MLSQQSTLGSSQQLLMVPIHLNLHTCTLTLVDLHTYTLEHFKHSNELTHTLQVHVTIHLLLDRYFFAHEQLHIQHILAPQCISTLPRVHMCTLCSPSCNRAMAISGRRGADASIHISTYGAAPPSQPRKTSCDMEI